MLIAPATLAEAAGDGLGETDADWGTKRCRPRPWVVKFDGFHTMLAGFQPFDCTRMTPQRGMRNTVCGQESGPALCEPAGPL
jgi:hypothetical protein